MWRWRLGLGTTSVRSPVGIAIECGDGGSRWGRPGLSGRRSSQASAAASPPVVAAMVLVVEPSPPMQPTSPPGLPPRARHRCLLRLQIHSVVGTTSPFVDMRPPPAIDSTTRPPAGMALPTDAALHHLHSTDAAGPLPCADPVHAGARGTRPAGLAAPSTWSTPSRHRPVALRLSTADRHRLRAASAQPLLQTAAGSPSDLEAVLDTSPRRAAGLDDGGGGGGGGATAEGGEGGGGGGAGGLGGGFFSFFWRFISEENDCEALNRRRDHRHLPGELFSTTAAAGSGDPVTLEGRA